MQIPRSNILEIAKNYLDVKTNQLKDIMSAELYEAIKNNYLPLADIKLSDGSVGMKIDKTVDMLVDHYLQFKVINNDYYRSLSGENRKFIDLLFNHYKQLMACIVLAKREYESMVLHCKQTEYFLKKHMPVSLTSLFGNDFAVYLTPVPRSQIKNNGKVVSYRLMVRCRGAIFIYCPHDNAIVETNNKCYHFADKIGKTELIILGKIFECWETMMRALFIFPDGEKNYAKQETI